MIPKPSSVPEVFSRMSAIPFGEMRWNISGLQGIVSATFSKFDRVILGHGEMTWVEQPLILISERIDSVLHTVPLTGTGGRSVGVFM